MFRFAKDRDAYRAMLRAQMAAHRDVRVLTYCITSNHVHLLLTSRKTNEAVSSFMQALQGEFALFYNRRMKRSGAFWGGRFHATMIDSGEYLWQCMRYIDLNMVRAGVVKHPAEWKWTGYGEIVGLRNRYRVVNMPEILERTGQKDSDRVGSWYRDWVRASAGERDPKWTESVAVGRREFVETIGRGVEGRMKMEIMEAEAGEWLVKER